MGFEQQTADTWPSHYNFGLSSEFLIPRRLLVRALKQWALKLFQDLSEVNISDWSHDIKFLPISRIEIERTEGKALRLINLPNSGGANK